MAPVAPRKPGERCKGDHRSRASAQHVSCRAETGRPAGVDHEDANPGTIARPAPRDRERVARASGRVWDPCAGGDQECRQAWADPRGRQGHPRACLRDGDLDFKRINRLSDEIAALTASALTAKVELHCRKSETAKRFQTKPGIGPIAAMFTEALAPDMAHFEKGPGLSRLAGAGARATLNRGQNDPGSDRQNGAARYPEGVDYRGNELHRRRNIPWQPMPCLAARRTGAQAENGRSSCARQSDGPPNPGDDLQRGTFPPTRNESMNSERRSRRQNARRAPKRMGVA